MADLAELTRRRRLTRPSEIEGAALALNVCAAFLNLPIEPIALRPHRDLVIQPRDVAWFKNTLRDGAWESADFARVVFPAPNRARRSHPDRTTRSHLDRLALLWDRGFFERVKYENNRLLYAPTNKLERELFQRGWLQRTRRDYDHRNRRRVGHPESWRHTVRIKDFMQALRRDVRAHPDVAMTEDGDAMQGDRADLYGARRFKSRAFDEATVSDKTVMLSFVNGRTRKKARIWKHRLFAIEWHCGGEPLRRFSSLDNSFLASKYERYHAYGVEGGHVEQFGCDNMTVLTIVEGGEHHLHNVCALADEVTGGRAPNRFLAVRASELMAAPLRGRWLNAQSAPVILLS